MVPQDLHMVEGSGPVIVVDDNETDAMLTRRCFEKSDLRNEFVWLPSGAELLDYLEQVENASAPMPALIMLDINMPGLDGFETLRRMREQPQFRTIPTLFMYSSSSAPEDEARAIKLGANGYVQKPSDISALISFFDSLAA